MIKARRRFPLLMAWILVGLVAAGLEISCAAPAAPASAGAKVPTAAAAATSAPAAAAPAATSAPAAAAPAASAQKISLRFAHHFPVDDPWAKAILNFADLANKKSNGQLQIQVFPASQIGDEKQNEEALRLGTLDFALGGPGVLTSFDPKIGIFDMPYLFSSYAQAKKIMDGPNGQAIFDSMRNNAGIRILASGTQGSRYVLTKGKPITKLADMKGLKIRIPDAQTYSRTFQLLGANPQAVAWSETYTALQTGVVDGMEGVPDIMRSSKMYEVGKNVARTNHIMATLQIMISEKTWQKLSPDLQKNIQDAAMEAWSAASAGAETSNKDSEAFLTSQGVQFTDPDPAEFKKAVSPWLDEWGQKNGASDLIKSILAGS